MSPSALVSRLAAVCGEEYVLTHPHALTTYGSDGLAQYHQMPVAVARPGSAEEVHAVVRTC